MKHIVSFLAMKKNVIWVRDSSETYPLNLSCLPLYRTRVVSPIIDVIDWQNLQYNATQWPVRGVFDWKLDFSWDFSNFPLPDQDQDFVAVQPLR